MSRKSQKIQLDTLSAALEDPAALSDALDYIEVRRGMAERLAHVCSTMTNAQAADFLGVSARSVTNYVNGVRPPDAGTLARVARAGWNINWLLTGEGAERADQVAETRASYGSQDLSEADLNVALEYTDDIIRATRATYVPRSLYAKLLRLMYQGVAQGLPVAEIHELGQQLVRAVISGTGEQGNGSQSGMDGPGQGSR